MNERKAWKSQEKYQKLTQPFTKYILNIPQGNTTNKFATQRQGKSESETADLESETEVMFKQVLSASLQVKQSHQE